MSKSQLLVIDLRSDTVTKPTPRMRKAMAEARVGDDVMNEDPTVKELEIYGANLFGMESSLFVPSGTMANLAAIASHCYLRGQELLVGDLSHIHLNEQGGMAQFLGVHHRTLPTLRNGTLSLEELTSKIRKDDFHYPKTGLICLENTHNYCGGTVLPLTYLQSVGNICRNYNLPLHMDGARIMNASVYLGLSPEEILKPCDSVSVCLSKGLGAPVGTLLAGKNDFIERARRVRKALGGGMRQSGIIAAAGLIALKEMVQRLEDDHIHAGMLANKIASLDCEHVTVDLESVQTNMVFVKLDGKRITAQEFIDRLFDFEENEEEDACVKVGTSRDPNTVRFVFHADISRKETQIVLEKVSKIISNL